MMWRRLVTSHLKTLALSSSPTTSTITAAAARRSALTAASPLLANRSLAASSSASSCIICRHFSSESETSVKKKVEDVMPIATGHEREELEAELEGRNILEIDHPVGPFGTKEAPAIVKSYYDKRIVGCVGGEGEDEHDTVWFWLKKGEPHECPVCSQYFVLEVVGPGGPPPGYEDDDDGH